MVIDLASARDSLIAKLSLEISDKRVLEAMRHVPREVFVSEDQYYAAYEDRPLSIGFGQTISQPYIVALMVQALELKREDKVLELGAGSGYEAAILAELARQVITVERISELAEGAKRVLEKLGYSNVMVYLAGKKLGWPDAAPYNAIIVSAGAPNIPQILLDQLSLGGRLVIPVGSRWQQDLLKVTKRRGGE